MAVPKDLWAIVGQKVVRFSLKTRDRRVAAVKARDELAQATQYFAELRASRLTDEQRQSVVEKLRNLGYDIESGSCPMAWCRSGAPGQRWLLGQAATTGRLTTGSSLSGAMVSRLI